MMDPDRRGRTIPAPEPDPATLEKCRRGDRRAIERMLREQMPALERLLRAMVGHGPDVEDLLQTTVTTAVRALPGFRGEAPLRAWLARIAVNAVRDHARRERRRPRLALIGNERESADRAPGPERLAEDREKLARLHHHLAAIGLAKRIAFVLHVVEGLSVDEVAALTGASRFATRSRIYWAGRTLRTRARRDPILRELFGEPGRGPS